MHPDKFEIKGQKEFFLWGRVPKSAQEVFIDKLLVEKGFTAASSIYVEEYQSIGSMFWTIVTFGMYIPIDYRIYGFGQKAGDE